MQQDGAVAGPPLHGYGRFAAAAAIAALLAFTAAVSVPAISDRTPFFTRGEPREALVVQTVFGGGGLILPRRNGDELPSKPPLFHWLGAAVGKLRGRADETAIRLPSLAAGITAAVATSAAAWVWWGPAVSLVSTVVLVTSFQWLSSSVSARVDMLLAACIALALLLFERAMETGRRIPILCFVLLAAATLTKGPVGLVLPVAIAVTTLALRGELRFLGWREIRLLAIAAAVAAIWYLAAFSSGGDAFVAKQILKENVFRVLDPDSVEAGHVAPFWYYVPLLFAGLAPWSLFAPGLAAFLWRRRAPDVLPLHPRVLFAVVWGLLTFVLFSLAGSKRAVYLLPAYPAYAMLFGVAWTRAMRDGAEGPAALLLRGGAILAASVVGVAAFVLVAGITGLPIERWIEGVVSDADVNNVVPMLDAARAHRGLVFACAALLGAAAWVAVRAQSEQRWARVFAATTMSMLALLATVSTTLLPATASRRSARSAMIRINSIVPAGSGLSFYRAFDYGAVFYRGSPIPLRTALTDVPELDGAWLLTWPAYLSDLQEEARRLDTGGAASGAYEVEEALPSEDHDPSDRTSLVLVRMRRIGDEHSGGN
jgi:4-amino-4-deoxy-L-arabinose transferase-like glycosyltransferase